MSARPGLSWRDVALPAGLLVVGISELMTLDVDGRVYAAGAQLAAAVLLTFRRVFTTVAATAAGVVVLLPPVVGPALDDVATPVLILIVSLYSLGRYGGRRGLGGVGAILVMTLLIYLTVDQRSHDWTDVVFVLSMSVPPYVFGRVSRRLADQGELLRQNQELVRREAVRDERDRIARELHDVIAHSVSAMVVQTAAAQDLVRTDPDKAESVLAEVAATGRHALAETGRLLHVIRDTDGELGLAPTPGLADVPELVERFRSDGLEVDLTVEEPLPAVPAGVDVSAYRIVQEALTNALRYAVDGTARVRISGDRDTLRIRAVNRCGGHTGQGSGLGLVGMQERVSVLGGTLRHGAAGAGLFEVDATLPVGP